MGTDADANITRVFREIAEELDKKLEKVAGEAMGFVIATFPLNRSGHANYISNCYRRDTIAALRKLLMTMENQPHDIPPHKKN